MKLIIAYIAPFKLDEIRDALKETGVTGLSAGNIQGFGRQAGHTETYRGAEYEVDFVPKVRIEVLTDDTLAPTVISTIELTARTGAIGENAGTRCGKGQNQFHSPSSCTFRIHFNTSIK